MFFAKLLKLTDGKYINLSAETERHFIAIEGRYDFYSEFFKSAVIKQGLAELTGTHEDCRCHAVATQTVFQLSNEFLGHITEFRLSFAAYRIQIFSYLDLTQFKLLRYVSC